MKTGPRETWPPRWVGIAVGWPGHPKENVKGNKLVGIRGNIPKGEEDHAFNQTRRDR